MTTAPAEARQLVELIAGTLRIGENVKAALSRVARSTGLPPRRVRGIRNGEARSIRSEEMDRLRSAARQTRSTEEAQHEFAALLARIAACEEALGIPAEDDPRPPRHALGREPGAAHRALDRAGRPVTAPAAGRPHT